MRRAAFTVVAGLLLIATGMTPANADTVTSSFDGFALGSVHNQGGWSSLGSAGSGCAVYDHAVVANTYGIASFGTHSLRISNAVTSGCFSDQTFSSSTVNEAGETSAANGGMSGGSRQTHFFGSFDIASTDASEQTGMYLAVSPDRGDGARMSRILIEDGAGGLGVTLTEYVDAAPMGSVANPTDGYDGADDFIDHEVASDLDRTVVHTVTIEMDLIDGPGNDVVEVCVDVTSCATAGSWEDYFRWTQGPGGPEWDGVTGHASRTADSLLFRTGGGCPGPCQPTLAGKGFLVDNVEVSTSSPAVVPVHVEGEWSTIPDQPSEYRTTVRPPINADGTSNFPKRRGVIPVQFSLSKGYGDLILRSDCTDGCPFDGSDPNDYGYVFFEPSTTLRLDEVSDARATFTFVQGDCQGGSMRYFFGTDLDGDGNADKEIAVHYGQPPGFIGCTPGLSGANMLSLNDARWEYPGFGGYVTRDTIMQKFGAGTVVYSGIGVDSGWYNNQPQAVKVDAVSLNDSSFAPEPTGVFTPTCDLPDAQLRWVKGDNFPDGAINEAESIQPKDTGQYFRVVDCKYIYNLDVSSLDPSLATRGGTYRVYARIDGTTVNNPARFDLR
jgi:hypothetical protein